MESDSTPFLPSIAQLVDEAAHRLARGVEHADQLAVPGRHDGFGAAFDGAFHHGEEIVGALRHVDMRIFLEQHQRGGVAQGAFADVAMQVELDAHRHVGSDDLAHMGQQVAFAVVIALGHHGAVHGEQHAIDRHRRLEVGQISPRKDCRPLTVCRRAGERRGFPPPAALASARRATRRRHADIARSCVAGCGRGRSPRKAGVRWGWRRGVGLGAEQAVKIFFMGRDLGGA
jgi:hypothetical protein